MERQIPDPLTVEDLRRDPDLIFALHARGRRMRAQACTALLTGFFRRIRAWQPTLGTLGDRGYRHVVNPQAARRLATLRG